MMSVFLYKSRAYTNRRIHVSLESLRCQWKSLSCLGVVVVVSEPLLNVEPDEKSFRSH